MLSTLTTVEALHVAPDLCSCRAGRRRNSPGCIGLFFQRDGAIAHPSRRNLHQLGEQRDLLALGRRLEQASQGAGYLEDTRPGWLLRVDEISVVGAALR